MRSLPRMIEPSNKQFVCTKQDSIVKDTLLMIRLLDHVSQNWRFMRLEPQVSLTVVNCSLSNKAEDI